MGKIIYLGYTLPYTKEDLSRIKNYYYGKWTIDKDFYDNFFKTYDGMDVNRKAITIYLTFFEMMKRNTESLSQNARENVYSNVFSAIAKNIEKLDIRYRGLAKYIKTVILSRIINERNVTKRYGSLVDENVIIEDLSEEVECDRDYDVPLPSDFQDFVNANGKLGKLVVDIYQNDIRTAVGLYKRALEVEPKVDKDKLKPICRDMIRLVKKGAE